jgi:hypothetical protein
MKRPPAGREEDQKVETVMTHSAGGQPSHRCGTGRMEARRTSVDTTGGTGMRMEDGRRIEDTTGGHVSSNTHAKAERNMKRSRYMEEDGTTVGEEEAPITSEAVAEDGGGRIREERGQASL